MTDGAAGGARGAGPLGAVGSAVGGFPRAELGVFFLALAVRFTYLLEIRGDPFFARPIVDARMYDEMAVRIASGEPLGGGAFTQAPLYPYFLGLVYRLLGHDYFLARFVQVAVGAAGCALIVAIGRRIFNPRVALLAGLTAALYGTLVFYDAELLRPVLVIFLALCALLALLAAAERPSRLRWGGAGLLLGLAAITWETTLLFVPAALLWLWRVLRPRLPAREIAGHAACLCLAAAAAILPVTLRNYRVSGDLVLVSAWGGVNFYLGNNAAAERTVAVQPGRDWDALLALPERQAGLTRPAARSRWFYRETFAFIREHPLAWAGLLGRKLARFWDAAEFEPNNDLAHFRDASALFRLLYRPGGPVVVPFGVVGPLALLGMILLPAREARARLLLLFTLAIMSVLVLYHVRARYRLVAV
ncbi:MAG TPA: glycosyltransferase family 39 protein, partial [Candidatus Methanoperedens sp.]|nr:glycosyltransferase family 39 protein [Candidatus Methanoperedens sp.]